MASSPESIERPPFPVKPFARRLWLPSPALAAIIGPDPVSRGSALKRLWVYIRARRLQYPRQRSVIIADAKLRAIIACSHCKITDLPRHLMPHFTAIDDGDAAAAGAKFTAGTPCDRINATPGKIA